MNIQRHLYTLTNTHTHTRIHARTHARTHTGMGICYGQEMEHLKAAQAFEGAARQGAAREGAARAGAGARLDRLSAVEVVASVDVASVDRLSAVGQDTRRPLSVSPRQPLVTSVCERQREKVGGVGL